MSKKQVKSEKTYKKVIKILALFCFIYSGLNNFFVKNLNIIFLIQMFYLKST